MTSMSRLSIAGAAGAVLFALGAAPAEAHPLAVEGASFMAGFGHPWTGIDHVLAMLAVGIWAAQLGGRARFTLPAVFLVAMVLAGTAGALAWGAGVAEIGIVASVVGLGLAIAFALRPPLAVSLAAVGLFALAHGYAHGAEAPEAATPAVYAAGFVLATGMLLGLGLVAGTVVERWQARGTRVAGASIAAAGLALAVFL